MAEIASRWRLFFAAGALVMGGPATSQNAPAAAEPAIEAVSETAQPVVDAAQARPQQPPPRQQPPPQQQVLPTIPPPPTSALPEYPNCRDEHLPIAGRVAKATKVRSCILRLAQYDSAILQVFARRMETYRDSLRALWDQVNNGRYTFPQKTEFYARIRVEFENSKLEGSYMDQFRLIQGRYLADRAYLDTAYCNLITCPRTTQ